MSRNIFDVVVIGAGPGGYVAAIRSAQLGLKTAIVEKEHMGGICLNWGCIPTKAMLRSAEIFHLMHRANEFGLSAEKISFDLQSVIKRSRGISKQLNQGVTHLLKKNKVKSFIGDATIMDKGKVRVLNDEKSEEILAKNIIIASGARARARASRRAACASSRTRRATRGQIRWAMARRCSPGEACTGIIGCSRLQVSTRTPIR